MANKLTKDIDLTVLDDCTKELANLYRNELQNINAKATGNLQKFQYGYTWDGEKIVVYFLLPKYYGAIEDGRMPTQNDEGGVLYPAILNWVKLKGIQPDKAGESQESIAHAITRKIHRVGFFGIDHHGRHPLMNALLRAKDEGLIQRLATSVVNMYNENIKVDLTELAEALKVKHNS